MSTNVNESDVESTRALVKRLEGTIALSQIKTTENNSVTRKLIKVLDEETYTKVPYILLLIIFIIHFRLFSTVSSWACLR